MGGILIWIGMFVLATAFLGIWGFFGMLVILIGLAIA